MKSEHLSLINANSVSGVCDAFSCFTKITEAAQEYYRVREEETTKRVHIAALREAKLDEIRAKENCILTFLDRNFKEREENFQALFRILDNTIEEDNIEKFIATLGAIVEMSKDLHLDELRNKFKDPDWEHEI